MIRCQQKQRFLILGKNKVFVGFPDLQVGPTYPNVGSDVDYLVDMGAILQVDIINFILCAIY